MGVEHGRGRGEGSDRGRGEGRDRGRGEKMATKELKSLETGEPLRMASVGEVRCLKLTIAYDGTDYAGWQAQVESAKTTGGKPTIQQTLERAIERFCGESVRLLASGRTDAGVHALGQVVSLRTRSVQAAGYSPVVWLRALNARLPRDIRVLRVDEAADSFHPTHDTRSKRYRYRIDNDAIRNVFQRRTHWFIPQPLDVTAMRTAAKFLVGTHDFSSFESAGSPRSTSVRTIFDLSITHEDRSEVRFEIEADGFLYNMVRAITGTLVQVGKGRWAPERVVEILAAKNRSVAGPNAPPHGLCLLWVNYSKPT